MTHDQRRWLKIGLGSLVAIMLFAAWNPTWEPLNPLWQPSKERYFSHMAASCSEQHGLPGIPWQEVPAFDGTVQVFVARNERERATLACINRWAGVIMSDHVSSDALHPTIEYSTGGDHIVMYPRTTLVDYVYIHPAG